MKASEALRTAAKAIKHSSETYRELYGLWEKTPKELCAEVKHKGDFARGVAANDSLTVDILTEYADKLEKEGY